MCLKRIKLCSKRRKSKNELVPMCAGYIKTEAKHSRIVELKVCGFPVHSGYGIHGNCRRCTVLLAVQAPFTVKSKYARVDLVAGTAY